MRLFKIHLKLQVPHWIPFLTIFVSGGALAAPDLYITNITAPASTIAGEVIVISDVTEKNGDATTESITSFYLSNNNRYDTWDIPLGERIFPAFGSGLFESSASTSVSIPPDTVPGTYYIIARADSENSISERNEQNNNKSTSIIVNSSGPTADLYITELTVPQAGDVGSSILLSDTTAKNGEEPVVASETSYYLSINSWYDTWDIPLGSRNIPASGNGLQTSTAETSVLIPTDTTAGNYYLIAMADSKNSIDERNEHNNSKSAQITVNAVGPTADMYILDFTVPHSGVAGAGILISDTTEKNGADSIPASVTSYYLSANSWYDAWDIPLGSRVIPSFESGQHGTTADTSATLPLGTAPGQYYIIAKADSGDVVSERNETNNSKSRAIKIYRTPEYVSQFGRGSYKTDGELNFPSGIATDTSGNVYTCEQLHNRISKFDPSGNFLAKWDSLGCLGLGVDAAGSVYVAERTQNRISKFDSNGALITRWGTLGTGDGQFNNPRYVAVNRSKGLVYVTDSKNYRVQVFDTNGNFQWKWGSEGADPEQFSGIGAFGIAIDQSNDDVYVTNPSSLEVKKFDSFGNFLFEWGTLGKYLGEMRWPRGIDVDRFGSVYVADSDNERIQKFDSSGNSLGVFQGLHNLIDGPFHPRDVAVDLQNDVVYAAAAYSQRIDKFDLTGNFLISWGWLEHDGAVFNQPKGLVLDHSGNIFVADTENFLLKKFDMTGQHIKTWGGSSRVSANEDGADGLLDFSSSMVVDDNNIIYVLRTGKNYEGDPEYKRIQKFDADGNFLSSWNYSGFDLDMEGIAFNPDTGFIYVANTPHDVIQVFDKNGTYQFEFGGKGTLDGQFRSPAKMVVDPRNGNIFVVDVGNQRIQKYSSTGNYINSWGTQGTTAGAFHLNEHSGINIDSDGNVYIADTGNSRVQAFDENGQFILAWGLHSGGDGQFFGPTGIAIDSNDFIYVVDVTLKRIQTFSSMIH
jgi:DNA-binding beta-propeller fold protein YncE